MSGGPVDFRAFYLDYDVCGVACECLRSTVLHLLTIRIGFPDVCKSSHDA